MPRITIENLSEYRDKFRKVTSQSDNTRVVVHMGTCGIASGAREILDTLNRELQSRHISTIEVTTSGCAGYCSREPMITVSSPVGPSVRYVDLNEDKLITIIDRHLAGGDIVSDLAFAVGSESSFIEEPFSSVAGNGNGIPLLSETDFFKHQKLLVLRNRATLNPESIEQYIARDGYSAFAKALGELTSEKVIENILQAGLRGRGGAGFPTGRKWELCRKMSGDVKYIVCNADEGDPGAFMDRSLLESDPHSVLEGMLIGAYAMGAHKGFIYVRIEYPLALRTIREAIQQAESCGILGKGIMGSDFDFTVKVVVGAGAFVCGEETALIASIEGRVGEPRQRPPFPIQRGLWGKPTNINNVETWSNVAPIILQGPEWYSSIGTDKSKGTKIFSLVGKIINTGLVEVPMGIPLGDIVFNIGGGIPNNKKFKAVQTGGPSGGCLPIELLNLPVDYDKLAEAGSIMGSGGMVVMDEDTCMVDVARYFLTFLQDESCGKCFTCRKGIQRMLELVTDITEGRGTMEKLDLLEQLANVVKDTTQCGLGQTAANPVLSTLRYFRSEYIEHIEDKHCSAGVCRHLYVSPCQNSCPAGTNAPAYIGYIAAGQYEDAMLEILNTNPFPSVCGRVCDSPCQTKCRRGQIDASVAIRSLKRFVGDYFLKKGQLPVIPSSREKMPYHVAVIGAGPAGLGAAYFLARIGYPVTVFEGHSVAGGMLAEAIPASRLPNNVLGKEIQAIEKLGVEIKLNTKIGDEIKFADLVSNGYDAIYVAVGMYGDRSLGIEGEELEGVHQGVDFLRDVKLGEHPDWSDLRVVIIGGGNTAVDAARSCVRLGASEVHIIYRRTREEMPAFQEEIEDAIEEGVILKNLAAPVKIIGDGKKVMGLRCIEMRLDIFGKDGRRKPVPVEGSEFDLDADIVIPAIGEFADVENLFSGLDVDTHKDGTIRVNKDYQTSIPKIFAGGDITTGPATVIRAIGAGQRVAESIDRFLSGGNGKEYPWRIHHPAKIGLDPEAEPVEYSTIIPERIDLKNRIKSFQEVEQVYTESMARKEARRCLHCEMEVELLKENSHD